MSLSERQENILAFIRQFGDEHGFPPTIREIGKAVGISSTSVVKYNLERLEEKGKLERSDEISRGLRLKDGLPMIGEASAASRLRIIPKLGRISAGARRSRPRGSRITPSAVTHSICRKIWSRPAANSMPSRLRAIR